MTPIARTGIVLGGVLAALLVGGGSQLRADSEPQRRQPQPREGPAPEARRPPAQPPASAPRPSVPTPPAKAGPRGPAPRQPVPARPDIHPYIYPYYPLFDFDFVYQFPYGAYPYWRYGYPYPPYGAPFPAPGFVVEASQEHGSVKLAIPQKDAAVYVDGFFVGAVEDFDGSTEPLNLTPGPHRLEVRGTEFQVLTFDVNLQPGQAITYRGALQPETASSKE